MLLKGCQIVGVFWGVFAQRDPARNGANVERVLGWLAEGKIRPHVDGVLAVRAGGRGARSGSRGAR